MNPKFLIQKVNWKAVAEEASRLAGKAYPPDYIRDVAHRSKHNQQLEPILQHLGAMQGEAA